MQIWNNFTVRALSLLIFKALTLETPYVYVFTKQKTSPYHRKIYTHFNLSAPRRQDV